MFSTLSEFHDWFTERRRANDYRVERVPLDRLDGWSFEEATGNLAHRSGRFFSVQGLDVRDSGREVDSWRQPIIVQPEHGILGMLVKEFDGVPHCLLQAKMEPGNVNLVQLSPTVQATWSNYTGVHGGKPVPYLEHFVAPRGGRILSDALQSEQASWFLAKRNRNMIVWTDEDVPVREDFCWLSVDQLAALLRLDNLVNMDSRTVLSGAAMLRPAAPSAPADSFDDALARSVRPDSPALHDTAELLSWFTEAKGRCTLTRRLVPLREVLGWAHSDGVIGHVDGRHFTVLGVDVRASNREVGGWSQPMFAPCGQGVVAFLARRVEGVLHLLVQARIETGALDRIEMAPTVQCQPGNYRPPFPADRRPRFLDEVLGAPPERIRFAAVHSEEGGRFYHAQNRYLVVEVGDDFPLDVPPDFAWLTVAQLVDFVRFGSHLNVEARSLLTFLTFFHSEADRLTPVS
ncbi:NDP-hexose 2,3-dehydratase family protein [Micromonospora sp. NPDC002296]|uniref:NDP-hexose 2,3-dehydratase family protein n=1 Tax=Micromonospora sp. NPDC002296 TaxID=3154271 RepID=UPI00331FBA15